MKYYAFGQPNEIMMVLLHGDLIAEYTEQFVEKVKVVHAASRKVRKNENIRRI